MFCVFITCECFVFICLIFLCVAIEQGFAKKFIYDMILFKHS